jgi:hypothetical protein
MRRRGNIATLALLWAFISLTASPAFAQEGNSGKGPGSIKSAQTIQELEEMVIEGKIQKPEVMFFLSKGETEYNLPIRKENFVTRIIKSVEKNPF